MIPASYMFKDIYRSHWEEPEVPATPRSHWYDGLAALTGVVTSILTRRARSQQRYFGGHAYE